MTVANHADFDGVDLVLFDLDGTLIDSAPDLGAAADQMRTDRGMTSRPPSCTDPWPVPAPADCWGLPSA